MRSSFLPAFNAFLVFCLRRVLKLNDNQLQRYDAADLRFFTDLKELDLSNNNLTCIADGNYFRERCLAWCGVLCVKLHETTGKFLYFCANWDFWLVIIIVCSSACFFARDCCPSKSRRMCRKTEALGNHSKLTSQTPVRTCLVLRNVWQFIRLREHVFLSFFATKSPVFRNWFVTMHCRQNIVVQFMFQTLVIASSQQQQTDNPERKLVSQRLPGEATSSTWTISSCW